MRLEGAVSLSLLLVFLPAWQACGGTPDSEVGGPDPAVYDVRGVVRQIRQVDDGQTQLSILHEAIPDFIGINGDVVGMKSMTMPFTVADSVDLTDIEPGSRVQIELSVDWNRSEPALILSIELLPEDAVLSFEAPG